MAPNAKHRHFLSHRVRAPLAQPAGNQRTADVIRTEEKGSGCQSRRAPAQRRLIGRL